MVFGQNLIKPNLANNESIGKSISRGVERRIFQLRSTFQPVRSYGCIEMTTHFSCYGVCVCYRAKRSVTIPYVGGEGFGFKMIGGNAVGLFVSEVLRLPRKELQPGDQILEINGQSTRNMTHFEASQLMGKEKVSLLVTENTASEYGRARAGGRDTREDSLSLLL